MSATYLGPQAALETAVVDAIISQLGYKAHECSRCHEGRPLETRGNMFVGVWSRNEITAGSRSALDEAVGCNVTLSIRATTRPARKWHEWRDEVERRAREIIVLVHQDSRDHRVVRAASTLAGLQVMDGVTTSTTLKVGYQRGLVFERAGPVEEKRGEWWASDEHEVCGLAYTMYFGGARRVQYTQTAG